jgi:hypothetical protein
MDLTHLLINLAEKATIEITGCVCVTLLHMFKETFERGGGEVQKNELQTKLDQLTLMRKKKAMLEPLMSIVAPMDQAKKTEREYKEVSALIEQIEKDITTLKETNQARLTEKFEGTPAANDEDPFDAALRGTGEGSEADRLQRRAA